MFITKKNLEKKLGEAQKEVYEKFERIEAERNQNMWAERRFDDVCARMNTAFPDIDRRLTALEQAGKPSPNVVSAFSRY